MFFTYYIRLQNPFLSSELLIIIKYMHGWDRKRGQGWIESNDALDQRGLVEEGAVGCRMKMMRSLIDTTTFVKHYHTQGERGG